EYKVNATYVGLDNVTITNATISISKTPTEITVENATLELLVGDSIGTGAALTPADAGELTFTSNNITVAKVEDGKIIAVGEGTAIITVSFSGNDDYAAAEDKTINIDVIKYDSKVTIEPINSTVYPNNVTIKYSIENKTNVTVTIDGVSDDKIIITNDTITVIGLDAGEYTIVVINNESSIYHKSNDTKTFTVNKQATSITAADVSTTYNINKELVITLKDSKGNPLTGASITVDLNGAKTYTTDKNGQVKVSTKGLAPKAYTAKVTFNGNTNYDKSNKDVKVTVKKATPKLTAKKKTFKKSVKIKKYTITLKYGKTALKKVKVYIKIKGKTYKATTNSKGKAVFKIKKLNKKGTFKATITYKGNKYYNKVSKKANIKVIVSFKTVSKGSKDKSTVKEIQQALKDHGYYLSYKGHYLKVDGKFQSCTERSVKEFQHDKGLKVTGKVDEKTAKKLGLI
ncbi:MAG: peptidoglycan-binding protein, partial [Clostridia bacterium]|nr:peptidoglycan-binding protein [Clostridia bacterium]